MSSLGGCNVITRSYKRQKVWSQRKRLEDTMLLALQMEARGQKLRNEECRQPLGVREGKQTDSSLETRKKNSPADT